MRRSGDDRRARSQHDRGRFSCGREELDRFLREQALRHRQAGVSKTMVLPSRSEPGAKADICAFYTLSHTTINRAVLPPAVAKKLPRYPVPVLLLAQLAVHQRCHGQGLGEITLVAALRDCVGINRHLPSQAVVVDALDEGVIAFYQRFGFVPLSADGTRSRLYLPMQTAVQLFASEAG